MKYVTLLLLSVTVSRSQDFASTAGQFLQSILPNLVSNQDKRWTPGQQPPNIFEQTVTVAGKAEKKNYENFLRQVQNQTLDDDILRLSEAMFTVDNNSVYTYIQINLQGKTTPESKNDESPFNLLYVPAQIWNAPTIKPFVDLFHNYHKNIIMPEFFTQNEETEQMTYISTILNTGPIRILMDYLVDKGLNHLSDPKEQGSLLKKIWFTRYARHWSGFCKCSSPFENIFMAEFNGDDVLGLRSWLFFAMREQYGKANYLGFMEMLNLYDKGIILKHHSVLSSTKDAPILKMFIGTSPELEMALYTLCFLARPNTYCGLNFHNVTFTILTKTINVEGTTLIDTAYPGF